MTSPGGSLTERLQLVVDATTSSAEAKFTRLTGAARDTGEAAGRSAVSVRDAADRVAAAQDRQAAAVGSLRVAMTRLDALRQSGRARADQLAAAEERVAAAQRTLHTATTGTLRATEDQTRAQQRATTELDTGERSGGRLSGRMDELKGRAIGAAAALGGAGLVAALRELSAGFAEGARDSGLLANSMNASVEQAGAFLGLVGALGLDLNDLLEIQAEFAQKVQQNGQALQDLGVQTDRNADGTVNWSETLVNFLSSLQNVEDATERNRLGFQFLGEEGYKQLSKLVSSGVSVRDALEKIGTPFTDEDVAMAAEYDAAMLNLTLTGQRTQQQLGRLLLPVVTSLTEGLGDLIDVVQGIPAPLAIATVAAITLGITGWTPASIAGARLAVVMAAVQRQVALYNVSAAISGRASATLAAGMAGAAGAGRGLMAAAGGPLGLALIGAAAGYTLISDGVDKFRESSRKAAVELQDANVTSGQTARKARELGQELANEAGFWDGLAASRRGAAQAIEEQGGATEAANTATGGLLTTVLSLVDQFSGGELAAAGYADEIERQREELGAYGAQTEQAQTTQKALNDLIAEGTTGGAEFGEAVQAAAEAQAAQTHTSDLAEAALAAYNATTRDAVQTQLDLYSAQLGQRDGLIGLMQTVWDARDAVDDLSTPWSEVEEATNRVISSTLDYASSAADAAVAAARANGTVVDSLTEAQLRADATISALRQSLDAPGLTQGARDQITGMIEDLQTAKDSGDIEAVLRLTGVDQTTSELDQATGDRDTTVHVESRGGPAVKRYLDGLAQQRLAIIRVESRNGPAVDSYLDRLALERLAIIRVESRGGPAVDDYLDRLADQARTAYIDVRERGAGAVAGGGPGLATLRGAPGAFAAGTLVTDSGTTIQHMTVVVQADERGRLTQASLAEAGKQAVAAIRAHEARNGSGWRRRL